MYADTNYIQKVLIGGERKVISCQYCKSFQKGRSCQEYKIPMRLCTIKNKPVQYRDKACDEFQLAKRFWCERHKMWLDPELCKMNQKKRRNGCVTCRQGEIINKLLSPAVVKSRFQRREKNSE